MKLGLYDPWGEGPFVVMRLSAKHGTNDLIPSPRWATVASTGCQVMVRSERMTTPEIQISLPVSSGYSIGAKISATVAGFAPSALVISHQASTVPPFASSLASASITAPSATTTRPNT